MSECEREGERERERERESPKRHYCCTDGSLMRVRGGRSRGQFERIPLPHALAYSRHLPRSRALQADRLQHHPHQRASPQERCG